MSAVEVDVMRDGSNNLIVNHDPAFIGSADYLGTDYFANSSWVYQNLNKNSWTTVSVRSACLWRHFDIPWQQIGDLGDRMIADAGKNVTKIGFWVDIVEFCRFNQRQNVGGAFPAFV